MCCGVQRDCCSLNAHFKLAIKEASFFPLTLLIMLFLQVADQMITQVTHNMYRRHRSCVTSLSESKNAIASITFRLQFLSLFIINILTNSHDTSAAWITHGVCLVHFGFLCNGCSCCSFHNLKWRQLLYPLSLIHI